MPDLVRWTQIVRLGALVLIVRALAGAQNRTDLSRRVYGAGRSGVGGKPGLQASQTSLRNHLLLGRWDVGLNCARYQLAQSTGTFQANSVTVTVGHRFSAFRPQDDF